MKHISLLVILVLFTSCIKTAEQVQRERRMENISEQFSDSQNLIADMITHMKEMQAQLDKLNGRVEELEHRQRAMKPEAFKEMNESVALLKNQRETDSQQLSQIQQEIKEQRAYLEKVVASLGSMSQAKHNDKKEKKKSAKEELAAALELIKANKYAEARSELEALIDHKELSPGDHNKVMHGLGKVEFYTKNYDKALTYFSKIYTKFPKSSMAPSSLLFIGKTLQKMSKTAEAKEAFAKVVEDYPGSKEADEAKKQL